MTSHTITINMTSGHSLVLFVCTGEKRRGGLLQLHLFVIVYGKIDINFIQFFEDRCHEYMTCVIYPRRQMSRIRNMHEWCDRKLDTRTVILLDELAIELRDYPISTNNRTVRLSNFP